MQNFQCGNHFVKIEVVSVCSFISSCATRVQECKDLQRQSTRQSGCSFDPYHHVVEFFPRLSGWDNGANGVDTHRLTSLFDPSHAVHSYQSVGSVGREPEDEGGQPGTPLAKELRLGMLAARCALLSCSVFRLMSLGRRRVLPWRRSLGWACWPPGASLSWLNASELMHARTAH